MANRRMFAKTVIDTDKFMEMPLSTQCLYFHLLLRGDDDGFVANPKQIMRQLGTSEDDMKILIAKEYVIVFDSGVIVIRDWFVHNQLRRDRYTPTACREKSMLTIGDGNVYQLTPAGIDPSGNQAATNGCQYVNPSGNHTGNHLVPQDRLGKDSIGKYRIDEDRGDDLATNPPFDEILVLYHEICPDLIPAKVLTPQRKTAMKELYAVLGNSMEAIKEYFRKCADTPFLCGKNRGGWRANLDFLLDPSKYANIVEGKYEVWRNTHGDNGAAHEHSGKAEEQISSHAAGYEAFGQRQELPGDV